MIDDRDVQQFFSAARCYRERDDKTPTDTKSWGEWFEKRWGETLDAYFARAKTQKLVHQLVTYEDGKYAESVKQRADETRELMRAERAKQLKKKPSKGKRA